jgi:CO/xanthine dehydrogenase Mo-binding subunit
LKQGAVNACGQEIKGEVILPEMLDKLCAETNFQGKRKLYATQTGDMLKGIGISIFYRGCGLGAESPDASAGYVCVHDDGSVMINSGLVDNGQGLKTSFTQIVAEVLSIPPHHIHFIGVDTHTIPDSGITAASRATVMGAKSLKLAAEELKVYLLQTAALMFHSEPAQVELKDGVFRLIGVPAGELPFAQVCNVHFWSGQQSGVMRWYKPPALDYDLKAGYGAAFPTYAYGAVVAEVEIDRKTGAIKVEKVTSAHDLGTVINPKIVEGQIYGGILMGQGFAIMEDLAMRQGLIQNCNFDTYIIAASMDIPKMQALLFESADPSGTFGAKSIGEPATEGVAAAIISAIKNAAGLHIRTIPINKVSLHKMLQDQGKEEGC